MRITHLGHACLLIQGAGTQLLIDPGNYSSGFENLTGLDSLLVTHQHPDHIDAELTPDLLDANPGAEALVEPETVDALDLAAAATPFRAGESRVIGDFTIAAIGGQNGGPTLFHPGDSYADTPAGVDVLAVPLNAPWARVSETLAFVRAVAAPVAFPIHDGLLNDNGRTMYMMHVEKFAQAGRELRDLSDGTPYEA
jgi:L-ascorbate metabolism protein UlaG (beta-lactamase superfamily)